MATHKCEACLKKTVEDAVEIDPNVPGMVLPGSDCAPGRGHVWKPIGN